MFIVAWWTGRGYQTVLVVLLTLTLFAIVLTVTGFAEHKWIFGFGLLLAAAVNWQYGRRLNARSLAKVRGQRIRDRLFYRARNKFMSMPMETFSFLIAAAGLLVIALCFGSGD